MIYCIIINQSDNYISKAVPLLIQKSSSLDAYPGFGLQGNITSNWYEGLSITPQRT